MTLISLVTTLVGLAAPLALASAGGRPAGSLWDLPPEGSCVAQPSGGVGTEDAAPIPFKPGDTITEQTLDVLQSYLPEQVWEHRERFFFDGMHLEIGPCYRDYGPPRFFLEATEAFRGRAKLDKNGQLQHHNAGLPFVPNVIDPDDPHAALKWAWNWAYRYRAAGRFGDIRLSIVDRQNLKGRFEGEHYWIQLDGRAERPDDDYRFPARISSAWAGGGEMKNMNTGASCAFRQYATAGRRPDLFFWNAGARKVVRGTAPDAEAPLTGCLIDAAVGGGLFLHGGSPQLHHWKIVAVRDLIAPINAKVGAYPSVKDRDFGPWGISFANDRWELRRAIVLQGRLKQGKFEDRVERFIWYLDLQTLTPLYYASYRDQGEAGGVGYFVGRWSEDRAGYPRWPDDPARPVRLIDEVGSALVDWNQQDAVRIEMWNTVGSPPPDKKLMRMISQSGLRGH